MSTKIHNGYRIERLHGDKMGALRRMLATFGQQASQAAKTIITERIAEYAVQAFDARVLAEPVPWVTTEDRMTGCPISDARNHVRRRWKKIRETQERDPEVDVTCSVCVIPHLGRVYALLFADRSDFQSLWESQPGVRPFAYWNNTDEPDGISRKAWRARGKTWDAALGERGVPARVGLTYEATDSLYLPWIDIAEVIAAVPSLEQRASEWADAAETVEFCKGKFAPNDYWDVMKTLREYREWKTTRVGKSAMKKRIAAVQAVLKPTIVDTDLTGQPTPSPQAETE